MKKILIIFLYGLLSCVTLMSSVPIHAETQSNISVVFDRVKLVVNGNMTGTSTLLYDGRTYVQLRGASEAFGAGLGWDPDTNVASLTTIEQARTDITRPTTQAKESRLSISVIFDRVKLVVNGEMTDTPTLLYDGRTYVQLRGTADAFGASLRWDGETNTAYMDTANYAAAAPQPTIINTPTPAPAQQQSSMVWVTQTGYAFHRDSCSTIARSKNLRSMTRSEAISEGYSACKVCKP